MSIAYKALQAGEIRLLHLHPGQGDAPISCSISHVRLAAQPSYEALSYVWGEMGGSQYVILDGVEMAITENLHAALWHLRHPDTLLSTLSSAAFHVSKFLDILVPVGQSKERILWVDFLCINQADIDERSKQVRLMGSIYRSAESVLAWIGPAGGGSDYAFDHYGDLISEDFWHVEAMRHKHFGTGQSPYKLMLMKFCQTSRLLNAIWALQARPYWRRMWILQEVMLAKKLVVVCGWKQAGWNFVEEWPVNYMDSPDRYAIDLVDLRVRLEDRSSSTRASIFKDLVRDSTKRLCSEPRDRIYGLMGIMGITDEANNKRNEKSPTITIDYTKSVWEVYKDAMFYLRDIDKPERRDYVAGIMEFSGQIQEALAGEQGIRDEASLELARMGEQESAPSLDDHLTLEVAGTLCGYVVRLGPQYPDNVQSEAEKEGFWANARSLARGQTEFGMEPWSQAMYPAYDYDERDITPQNLRRLSSMTLHAQRGMSGRRQFSITPVWEDHQPITASRSHDASLSEDLDPRWFVTNTGHVGLAPTSTALGDLVFQFEACGGLCWGCTASGFSNEGGGMSIGRALIYPPPNAAVATGPGMSVCGATTADGISTQEAWFETRLRVDVETLQLLTL